MTEAERDELTELRNRLAVLEGFVSYHWGDKWFLYQDAHEMSKNVKRSVVGQPIGSGMAVREET